MCNAAIAASGKGRVYVLIRNTIDETVIGGERAAVRDVVQHIAVPAARAARPSAPYIARSAGSSSRSTRPCTTSTRRRRRGSPSTAVSPAADTRSIAGRRPRAIAAQASQPIDFPRTIENAYADGIGLFIEVGPGSSCTRLIDRILGDRPHVAVSACRPDRDSFAAVLDVLAACIAHRVPVDLSTLYGGDEGRAPEIEARPKADDPRRCRAARVPPALPCPSVPDALPQPSPTMNPHAEEPDRSPSPRSEMGTLAGALRRRRTGPLRRPMAPSCGSPRARPT